MALNRAIQGVAMFAESRAVRISPPSAEPELVQGDEDLLVRAFGALLETAIKFSTEGETVRVYRESLPHSPRIVIEGHGRSIPSSVLEKFFDVLSISEAITPGGDLGVSAALAYRILSLFGGSVSVANRAPSGITLTVSLRSAGEAGLDGPAPVLAGNLKES